MHISEFWQGFLTLLCGEFIFLVAILVWFHFQKDYDTYEEDN
jgi:hypothetical protein